MKFFLHFASGRKRIFVVVVCFCFVFVFVCLFPASFNANNNVILDRDIFKQIEVRGLLWT